MIGGDAIRRNCIERICFSLFEPDLVQTVAADAASEVSVELGVGRDN